MNGAGVSQSESLNGKGVIVEPDCDSFSQEKSDVLEKDGSGHGSVLSTSDKDMVQGQPKTQTGKSRQTQSGPLMPNVVLSHSQSERGRLYERFVVIVC